MSARREKPVSVSVLKAYDVIIAPLVTEKSTMGSENNQITFRVLLSATKPQIKAAVEEIFKALSLNVKYIVVFNKSPASAT